MPGFVDQAQLHAPPATGEPAPSSWRREAHVDRGGPDGGDGGHGGDVWLEASVNESSLLGFRDHPSGGPTDGVHGSGPQATRRTGQGPGVPVPVGTVVRRPGRHGPSATWRPSGRPVPGGRGRPGRPGQRPLPVQPPPGPAFAEQGEKGQEFWLTWSSS